MIGSRNTRTVAAFEFLSTVKRPGYLVATFGMPLFLALYAGLVAIPAYYLERKQAEPKVYGVVDEAGVLGLEGEARAPRPAVPDEIRRALEASGQAAALERALVSSQFVFRPYAAEPEARKALVAKDVDGYFVVPADYLEKGGVDTYAPETLRMGGNDARSALGTLLRQRLLAGHVDDNVAARVASPTSGGQRFAVTPEGELGDGSVAATITRLVVPILFMVLFLMSIMISAGYLLQGTATEKENKVVEVLLASANPDEILAGKLVGLGGAGLLQIGVWLVMLGVAGAGVVPLLVAARVEVPWLALALALPLFVLAFLFFGSLMLGTGSIGSNMREAQQLSMVWSLTAVLPFMLLSLLIQEPHGTVARVLTWIPFSTAPVTVFRASVDPAGLAWWEIAGAFAVLIACTWLALQLGARLFRVGLLISGARPKFREILRQARLAG